MTARPGRSGASRRWTLCAALALALACAQACATAGAQGASSAQNAVLDRLLTLIADRLNVAPDVARAKWNVHAPIEDLPREQHVITSVGRSAGAYGVDREAAERFFLAQIEASKIVQRAMTAEFTARRTPPFPVTASLDTDIRPVLDRLTPEMLRALGTALPLLEQQGMRRSLERRSRQLAPGVPGGRRAMEVAVGPLTGRLGRQDSQVR